MFCTSSWASCSGVFLPGRYQMRVQFSAYDAEIGRTSGGVFNTTARAGSNEWRGSALYQNRPSWGIGRLF